MFRPALPADKQRAINTLGFGTVDKIFLRYEKPFWEDGLEGFQLLWEHDPWHADPLKDEGEIIDSESNWTWKIPGEQFCYLSRSCRFKNAASNLL